MFHVGYISAPFFCFFLVRSVLALVYSISYLYGGEFHCQQKMTSWRMRLDLLRDEREYYRYTSDWFYFAFFFFFFIPSSFLCMRCVISIRLLASMRPHSIFDSWACLCVYRWSISAAYYIIIITASHTSV